jgi:lipoyl(octanoyl) transferase
MRCVRQHVTTNQQVKQLGKNRLPLSTSAMPFTNIAQKPPSASSEPSLWPMNQRSSRPVHVYNYENCCIPYQKSWTWMQRLLKHRTKRDSNGAIIDSRDVFLLLEHYPVYTLGKASTPDNILFKFEEDQNGIRCETGYEIHRVERGGEVTFHGPGQITGYPMIDLHFYKQDLHWYLRRLEDVIILVLKQYGIEGTVDPEYTGVWIDGKKVCAIGINVSRWITIHGFALNVKTDLNHFKHIVPCGISNKPVTSLHEFVPDVDITVVRRQILQAFNQVFNAQCILQSNVNESTIPYLPHAEATLEKL